jgi:hypothetical protein
MNCFKKLSHPQKLHLRHKWTERLHQFGEANQL